MLKASTLIALALFLSVPIQIAWPQASTATVNGTVRDQSGAVIAGAHLALSNLQQGTKVETTSNQAGIYAIPGIIPGRYHIEVESPGMEKYGADFEIAVGQRLTVDAVLKPGATTTSVEIKDVTPMVNLNDSMSSHVIQNQQIDQLPRFGRALSGILVTVPGFVNQYLANGLRYSDAVDWSLDGAPMKDRIRGAIETREPGIDSIQEMAVDTNGVTAKYNSPMAVVLSTKSGTNTIHGSLFETNANSGLYFARLRDQGNVTPSYSNRNEFGASMGGPVYIPEIYNGRNKTFWFFAWEARHQLSDAFRGYSVPTAAMRAGDFSGLVNANGIQTKIYDPSTTAYSAATGVYTRQQFNYGGKLNAIDPSRASPLWNHLMKITPMPSLPQVNPLISPNWYGNVPTTQDNYTVSARFDHHFTDEDLFYARYSKEAQTIINPWTSSAAVPLLTDAANRYATYYPGQSLATSYVHLISPTFFNELLVAAFRQTFGQTSPNSYQGWDAALGLPNPFNQPQFPTINTIGLSGSGWFNVSPNFDYNTYFQIDDNVTKIVGKHQILAGVHLRRDYLNFKQQPSYSAGLVAPVANWTALWNPAGSAKSPSATPYTGSAIASAFLGADQYYAASGRYWNYDRQNQYALYLQDNYKVTPRLSLNLGLRWEAWPAMQEKNNNRIGFDPKTGAIVLSQPLQAYGPIAPGFVPAVNVLQNMGVQFESYQQAGLPQSLVYSNWKDFSPRVGLAYRVTGGSRPLVLRAGFSISYYPLEAQDELLATMTGVPMTSYLYYYPDSAGYYPDGQPGYSLRTAPTYVAGLNSTNVFANTAPGGYTVGNLTTEYLDPHQPDSRVADGNITLEKEVLPKTVLRVSWIANNNANVDSFFNMNPQIPQYVWAVTTGTAYPTGAGTTRPYSPLLGNIMDLNRMAYSNYSGIHVELERRFSNGISYQLFYIENNSYSLGNFAQGTTHVNLLPASAYLPSQVSGWNQDELNRQIEYRRNTSFPKHQLAWNWVVGIPVGRGKRFFGNMRPWLDAIAGGWQISGIGNWATSWWELQSSQFPTGAPLKIYGHNVRVDDCRSGRCLSAYLYSNAGWINPAQINQTNAAGKCIGVCGVPSGYQSFSAPLVTDPSSKYFGTNTVTVPLKNGTNYIGAWGGISPLNNQYFPGPGLWTLTASLFKEFTIREQVKLRFQWDVSNPTNSPEEPNAPNANGLIYTYLSGQSARAMQLTLRLLW